MWQIDKQFDFDYGHRVWTQTLIGEYCEDGNTCLACRHPHGHRGQVHIFLEASQLNDQGMVVDFKLLGWLKNWIDDYIDHKFIIDCNDPLYQTMFLTPFMTLLGRAVTDDDLRPIYIQGYNSPVGWVPRIPENGDSSLIELIEGYFIVNFVPTSENLSKWMYNIVASRMSKFDIRISRIDWFETPKSRSTYIPPLS